MAEDMQRPPAGRTEGRGEQWQGADPTARDRVRRPRPPDVDEQQPTLDDLLEDGRRRRDHGMATATYATDVAWTVAADRALADLAASGEPFTAEELRAIVGPPFGSANAMGPRFMAAANAGLIRRVGSRQATRPEAAGRWIAVWRGAP